jgi:predicted nucleic acid-binding protein
MGQVVLLDTGPLVACLDRREQWHEWATSRMTQVRLPLLTCEAVMTEACYLLRNEPAGLRQLEHWTSRGFTARRTGA